MMAPMVDLVRSFLQQAALVIGSLRLVEIKYTSEVAMKGAGKLNPSITAAKLEEIQDNIV